MRKTFPLHLPDRKDSWVMSSILVTLHKYVKRERRKEFPEGMDWWEFRCRIGANEESAQSCELADMPAAIEAIAQAEHPEVYAEIISVAATKPKRPDHVFTKAPKVPSA